MLSAQLVLADCRRAFDRLQEAESPDEFRVCWVAAVALVRAVGHVLHKVDGARHPRLGCAVAALYAEWRRNQEQHQIFWEFIEAERNSVLKLYEFGYESGPFPVTVAGEPEDVVTLEEGLYTPLAEGPFAGEDARDVLKDAITWWEQQLSRIESEAGRA